MVFKNKDICLGDSLESLFHCRIYPEKKLLVLKLLQPVKAADIARWESIMIQETLFSPDWDGIVDQRTASADLSYDDVNDLADLNKNKHKVKGRWVHLVNEPMSTALAVSYKRKVDELQDIETFSTLRGASEYFGYDVEPYIAEMEMEMDNASKGDVNQFS